MIARLGKVSLDSYVAIPSDLNVASLSNLFRIIKSGEDNAFVS